MVSLAPSHVKIQTLSDLLLFQVIRATPVSTALAEPVPSPDPQDLQGSLDSQVTLMNPRLTLTCFLLEAGFPVNRNWDRKSVLM